MTDQSSDKTEEATPSGVEDTEKGGPGEEERGGPHAEAEGHGEPDKSPKQTEEHDQPQRAEVSNYEIVSHWFGEAAERLGLADDVAAAKRVIAAQPGPVVLVGHSWGGTVITEAGTDEKVAALVKAATS